MTVDLPVVDQGEWLVEHRVEMDRGEATWLEALARFDLDQGWAVDGQLSCVDWLVWRAKLARTTAFEKLRIAHELRRRPVVAAAFLAGRVSYSAVRVILRMDNPDPEVDEALIVLAEAGTVADVERMVRFYQAHAGQRRPPPIHPDTVRAVQYRPGRVEGTMVAEVTLSVVEMEEAQAVIQMFVDQRRAANRDPGPDRSATEGEPVDDYAAAYDSSDSRVVAGAEPVDGYAAADPRPTPVVRADALMDLVRTAMAHVNEGHAPGADRYMVHVVAHAGELTTMDGTPVHPAESGRICCDSASVAHLVDAGGAPLALGRKTRQWSAAQRRAVLVRDGGHCRFPGCGLRHVDLHHVVWWERGGDTDVDNAMSCCPHHHTLVHEGFSCEGDANHELRFYRADGTFIGATAPAAIPC